MAVDTTLKSVQITNREATPRVFNSPQTGGEGVVHEAYGHLASVTAALSITSVIRLVEIPSNARVTVTEFSSAAQGAGKFDLGIYQTPANGGAVVSAAFFNAAIDAASAVAKTTFTATTYTPAKRAQPLWQALGLSVDPQRMYDICATVVTTDVTTGTGAIGLRVAYVR